MFAAGEDATMSQPPPDHPPFEQALSELERLVRELEDGQITLEESLARYERGISLLKHCYAQLQTAEQRIQLLCGADGDGNPIAKPFEHASTAEPAKNDAKVRRKGDQPEKLF
jgi:exodeoxyribonuclease VII small subunit